MELTDWNEHNFYKVSPTRKYVGSFIEKLKSGYQPTSAELEKVAEMNQGLSEEDEGAIDFDFANYRPANSPTANTGETP
jgi:hypothetical protein